MSLLPKKSYENSFLGLNLGMEATGVVRAVGKAVTNVQPGQAVICNVSRCFSNRINLPAQRTIPLPDGVSFEDGASIMSVYNTAHYALAHLARIRRGETVLIHAGAGGVGHAAISICLHVGATVYATASKDKRSIVHALGVDHVFDSRSISWWVWWRKNIYACRPFAVWLLKPLLASLLIA